MNIKLFRWKLVSWRVRRLKPPSVCALVILSCVPWPALERQTPVGCKIGAAMLAQRGWVSHAAAATCVLLIAAQTPWVVGDDATARFTVKVCVHSNTHSRD